MAFANLLARVFLPGCRAQLLERKHGRRRALCHEVGEFRFARGTLKQMEPGRGLSLAETLPCFLRQSSPQYELSITGGNGRADGVKILMFFRTTLILVCILGALLLLGRVSAQSSLPTESQVKAAFLFNFAKFVEWPTTAFADSTSPIVIGILGNTPLGDDLVKAVHDKTLNDRPLVVKEFQSYVDTTNCHILFISSSEKSRLPQILERLRKTSVLTVGEMDQFTEEGGVINFIRDGNKTRFQINEAAAKAAGLKVSSKLLNLAFRPAH